MRLRMDWLRMLPVVSMLADVESLVGDLHHAGNVAGIYRKGRDAPADSHFLSQVGLGEPLAKLRFQPLEQSMDDITGRFGTDCRKFITTIAKGEIALPKRRTKSSCYG